MRVKIYVDAYLCKKKYIYFVLFIIWSVVIFVKYNQTCIKRSSLVERKRGLIRQSDLLKEVEFI
jgi:hypothetical protein